MLFSKWKYSACGSSRVCHCTSVVAEATASATWPSPDRHCFHRDRARAMAPHVKLSLHQWLMGIQSDPSFGTEKPINFGSHLSSICVRHARWACCVTPYLFKAEQWMGSTPCELPQRMQFHANQCLCATSSVCLTKLYSCCAKLGYNYNVRSSNLHNHICSPSDATHAQFPCIQITNQLRKKCVLWHNHLHLLRFRYLMKVKDHNLG